MKKIYNIGELRKSIDKYGDNDIVLVEIHDDIKGEDLYSFHIDVIDGIELKDGSIINEVRLCI